jgi:hypothetical protein
MKNKKSRKTNYKEKVTKSKKKTEPRKILTLKNIIYALLIISILGTIAYFIIDNYTYEERYASSLKMKTPAIVFSIEPIDVITQGKLGSSTIRVGYKIEYAYKVNEIQYRGQQTIKQKIKNNDKIKYIYNNLNTWNFVAKYSPTKPDESYLTIE